MVDEELTKHKDVQKYTFIDRHIVNHWWNLRVKCGEGPFLRPRVMVDELDARKVKKK